MVYSSYQKDFVQAVGLPLGFLGGSSGGGVPIGGQYVTMLPPQQPPTPTSHHPPHLVTTFFTPGVQVSRTVMHQLTVQISICPFFTCFYEVCANIKLFSVLAFKD